jgi:hypothetical protein
MEGVIPSSPAVVLFLIGGCSVTWLAWAPLAFAGSEEEDPLAAWREGVRISPVLPEENRHSVHSYYTASPESPDGRWVLMYTSTTRDGGRGEIWIVERASGEHKVLARDVIVEDIHRAACQQWVSGGRRVAYHDCRDGTWVVVCVDIDTQKERVLAKGRQLGWGQPTGNLVALYGPHWDPGNRCDLEILDLETGEIRTVLTASAVKAAYPGWIAETFSEKPISIFFPVLSPDLNRVFFKMATPEGGEGRSFRRGLVCYDIKESRFLFMSKNWGHPGWCPDSKTISEVASSRIVLIDSDNGAMRKLPNLPAFPGAHPSVSPNGRVFATDVATVESWGGPKKHWGVAVANLRGGQIVLLDHFENSHGATSRRASHPHPSFSLDGRRLYYNVSATQWTRLYVAEGKE